jgi:hypothetical protein
MFYRLQPRHVKENEQIEGFGFAFTLREYLTTLGFTDPSDLRPNPDTARINN